MRNRATFRSDFSCGSAQFGCSSGLSLPRTNQLKLELQQMKKISPVSRSGRFARGPGADVAQFTESISFDWRLWRHDILGSLAHAAMLRKIGVLTKSRSRRHRPRTRNHRPRNRGRKIQVEARTRRRPHEHRGRADPARSRRRETAHRPLAQRPGRPRHAPLAARRNHFAARRNRRSAARARLARRKKCRRAHSRLHASATRAAGLSRAPSARLRRDARTRLRTALGLPLARERLPARQRRDCRLHAAARPRVRRQSCSASWTRTANRSSRKIPWTP